MLLGHGSAEENPTIGHINPAQIIDLIKRVESIAPRHEMAKLVLRGCNTDCEPNNLKRLMQNELLLHGYTAPVKGYDAGMATRPDGTDMRVVTQRIEPRLELDSSWTRVGDQATNDKSGLYISPTGVSWLLKPVADEHYRRATSEELASKFYGLGNIDSINKQLIWDKTDDKIFIGERNTKGLTSPAPERLPELDGLAEGLIMDIWLSNWSILQPGGNGIGERGEMAYRWDKSASLEYRRGATQAREDLSPIVIADVKHFMNPNNGPIADMFLSLTKEQKLNSFKAVISLDDELVTGVCKVYGPGTCTEREKLATALVNRKRMLEQIYNGLLED